MSLLDRYIARQFFVTFLFSLASFAALFVLINMVENLDRFIDHQIPAGRIAIYYLAGLPQTFLLTTPLSVLLASLFVTGKLSMQSELSALKSAGMSLAHLMRPFLLVSLLITGLNMVNSCWIIPSNYDWSTGFENRYMKESKHDNQGPLHIRESKNRILTVGEIGADFMSARSVSIESFEGPRITSRIDADSLRILPSGKLWVLYNTRSRHFSDAGERLVVNPAADTLNLSLSKNTFRMIDADPDAMTIQQHYQFVREKEQAGLSGLERARVKLQVKIAMPFASLIIVMIGVPLSTKKKRSGLALEASISLLVGLLYLGLQRTLSSVGYDGHINPILAAWLPNLLFIMAGMVLYRTANE
jgi:lipopolysaccharide export system permease protein